MTKRDEYIAKLCFDIWLLTKCMNHWEEVCKDPSGTSIGAKSCALCVEYRKNECVNCPIKEETGEPYCNLTPYHKVRRTIIDMNSVPYTKFIEGERKRAKRKAAAFSKEEWRFLYDLRKKITQRLVEIQNLEQESKK